MGKLFALIVLIIPVLSARSQDRQQAFDMNERLGRGINIGNTFEAPTETEWGNPWRASYFKRIAELGFQHVRVPVRWEPGERSMSSPPYTIEPGFLDRIEEVVDSALKYKLHVIINMHHHDVLFADPAAQKERFLSQWNQIAHHFKDHSDSLLFEVLNEPHANLTPELWNVYFADALDVIRETNPTRIVLLGVAEWGGLGAIPKLQLPDDNHIILTVHYYNPFPFTHQGADWVEGADAWLGTKWMDTEAERQAVETEFSYALSYAETNDIPIHVGEFGAFSTADMDSRERWTTFLARWFEANNMSWAYWEFSAGFGIFDPVKEQYVSALVDALLRNAMPEPTPVIATPVYKSNFSAGPDGWSLNEQSGADGTASVSGNQLRIAIASGGTEGWHLQLVKNNISLEQGKQYRISFTASASSDRGITFYAGRASNPWNAYSSYNGATLTTTESTYSYTFNMLSATDPAARLVFDLGTNTASVNISSVSVEEISIPSVPVTALLPEAPDDKVSVYPNPTSSSLFISHHGSYREADLMDTNGRVVASFQITDTPLDVTGFPSGVYLLVLRGDTETVRVRVVRD